MLYYKQICHGIKPTHGWLNSTLQDVSLYMYTWRPSQDYAKTVSLVYLLQLNVVSFSSSPSWPRQLKAVDFLLLLISGHKTNRRVCLECRSIPWHQWVYLQFYPYQSEKNNPLPPSAVSITPSEPTNCEKSNPLYEALLNPIRRAQRTLVPCHTDKKKGSGQPSLLLKLVW